MFDRFTDRARRVIQLAQQEARALNHEHIGTEHLLLGIAQEGEGIAAETLRQLDVPLAAVRVAVNERIKPGAQESPGHIPFSPACKSALESAMRQALQLNHPYIGTEHLLLGILTLPAEMVAPQVLMGFGVNYKMARQAVLRLLRGYGVPVPPAQLPVVPTTPADNPRSYGITLMVSAKVFAELTEQIKDLDPESPEYRLALARFLEAQARRQRRLLGK